MAKRNKQTEKPSEADLQRVLLGKSTALKEKGALLKEQMEATAKACNELLYPNKEENP